MTAQSKQAFAESAEIRWSHRKILFNQFQRGFKGTNRELAKKVILPYEAVHKRTAELLQDGKIVITGTVDYNGFKNSVYELNTEPELFTVKKLTLAQWLKNKHPEILAEYNKL